MVLVNARDRNFRPVHQATTKIYKFQYSMVLEVVTYGTVLLEGKL